jgi:hypothetical protein
MATCFVIQPFDKGGPYDRRYRDVLEPAIKDAGLEPYRVDEDPTATVLIDDIEKGIQDAEVCLADITTNNPNIWYEVGFALANGKAVVMVCLDPRPDPFPFDIRHRHIITYSLQSRSDFDKLKTEVTTRLQAQAKKAEKLQTVAAMSEIQNTAGLLNHEIAALVTIFSESRSPDEGYSVYFVKDKMGRSGYTPMAVSLAIEGLLRKDMIERFEAVDREARESYTACRLSPKGIDWLLHNQNRFRLKKNEPEPVEEDNPAATTVGDDDIPF